MSDIKNRSDTSQNPGPDIKIAVVLRLPADLLFEVDEAAEKRKLSRNAFMVKALSRVIEGERVRS